MPSDSEQRLHPPSYRGCWHGVSRCFLSLWSNAALLTLRISYSVTAVYDPRAFILHAVLLRQAFAHCGRFSTAASRRSLGSVSVPVWPIVLSDRLPVIALVGRYPTNKLIGRNPLPKQRKPPFTHRKMPSAGTIRHYPPFPVVIPVSGIGWLRVTHPFAALLARRLSRTTCMPNPHR
jgi:hypothetical protein